MILTVFPYPEHSVLSFILEFYIFNPIGFIHLLFAADLINS